MSTTTPETTAADTARDVTRTQLENALHHLRRTLRVVTPSQAAAALAAQPAAPSHDVHIWNRPGGHRWMAECDCGWQPPAPTLSEHAARELAAGHYIVNDGSELSAPLRTVGIAAEEVNR